MSLGVRYVLDASALLAYLQGEPGSALVQAALADGVFMCSVNYAEALCRLSDVGEDPSAADRQMNQQGLIGGMVQIVPVDADDAVTNAQLRQGTRSYGLSLGDRACLATGLRLGLPVLTADRVWANLTVGVVIHTIR